MAVPPRDKPTKTGKAAGWWACFIARGLLLAAAAAYKIIEWIGAMLFCDGPPELFLRHQGEALDATKDMGLRLAASIGAVLGATVWDCLTRASAESWS